MDSTGQPPPLLVSREERIVFALLVAAIAIGVIALGSAIAILYKTLSSSSWPIDASGLLLALTLFSVFGCMTYAIFGRWPGSVTSVASMAFAVPPGEIWDAVALRDDYPGWKKIYTGIQRLDEAGEVYLVCHGEDSKCAKCNLPRDPDRSGWTRRVAVLEARRPRLYRVTVSARGLSENRQVGEVLKSEDHTIKLRALAAGGTRVTIRSTVVRPKVWLAFLTFLGRPVKQELRSLQAHLDGTHDETLYGFAAKRMDLARNAPQHCGCPEQVEIASPCDP